MHERPFIFRISVPRDLRLRLRYRRRHNGRCLVGHAQERPPGAEFELAQGPRRAGRDEAFVLLREFERS